jgi:two-component system alkaline phosphatase synthesis response regulator PhoP
MFMSRILIVEDDRAMAVALRDGLKYKGYSVQVAGDGHAASRLASERRFDLIILDVMLPRVSGLDFCKQLRESGDDTPIIMLTARGQEIDKVMGLELGADDYVTKPFSFMELVARVEAVLRRTSKPVERFEIIQVGDLTLDFKKCEAAKGGKSLDLSHREFNLLRYFLDHRGEVVSRDQLLDSVWGYVSLPLSRTVDTHIAKLRQKIEDDPSNPQHIMTVHRAGYKFVG